MPPSVPYGVLAGPLLPKRSRPRLPPGTAPDEIVWAVGFASAGEPVALIEAWQFGIDVLEAVQYVLPAAQALSWYAMKASTSPAFGPFRFPVVFPATKTPPTGSGVTELGWLKPWVAIF